MRAVEDFALALRRGAEHELPRAILSISPTTRSEEAELSKALNTVLYSATVFKSFDNSAEFCFKNVEALFVDALQTGSHKYVVEFLNYLRLYQVVASYIRTSGLSPSKCWFNTDIPQHAAQLIDRVEEAIPSMPGLVSTALVLGKLYALQDRDEAAALFAEATRPSNRPNMGMFQLDCGATTYLDEKSLYCGGIPAERRRELPARQEHSALHAGDNDFLVVMSCEQRYFRMYLPYWLSVAEYLAPQRFVYHFLLVASDVEATYLVDSVSDLVRALAELRGYSPESYCRNISFSSIPVPSWCPNVSSFAACARLLYARDISEQTGTRVITQDIDLCLVEDPGPWFSALPKCKIALTTNRVKSTIDPWRKFLGGTFVLPHSEPAFEVAEQMEEYILTALDRPNSWFLDQNALAYLYEVEGGAESDLLFSLTELLPLIRPGHGHKIHYLFKRLQPGDPLVTMASQPKSDQTARLI